MVRKQDETQAHEEAAQDRVEQSEDGQAEDGQASPRPAQGQRNDGPAETQGKDEPAQLEEALHKAQAELDRHREAMLRMQAEMENQRKRMARDAEKSRKFALERMMKDLLQVRDSLERGLQVDDESATVEGLKEGKALTLKVLNKVMEDHGLEVIDPKGEAFNPELHEAMTMAPTDEVEENTVIEVLQKGFRLHDRLIRPAMVVVSKKPG